MATKYAQNANKIESELIRAGIRALLDVLGPYRNDKVITKKLFGILSISITIGEILDFLSTAFNVSGSSTITAPSKT